VNRIQGLLATQGIRGYPALRRDRRQELDRLITGDGRPLPENLRAEVTRLLDRLELILAQIVAVERARDAIVTAQTSTSRGPALLMKLKSIGPEFAMTIWSEGLFRTFSNRRQLGAFAGLSPSPYQSGNMNREQGISKSGNKRLRTAMIELAWLWLRNQAQY
jgi:transposase